MPSMEKLVPGETVIFLCDIQTKFRKAIYGFDELIGTVNKMLKIAQILQIPVIATEQNPKALGQTAPELALDLLGPLYLGNVPKTLFSMVTPEVMSLFKSRDFKSILLVGIESTLDLLSLGYNVHIIADGVSSCNKEEIPIALSRMQQAGACITTSESAAFQLMADSGKPDFRAFSAAIKGGKESTQIAPQRLSSPFTSSKL